MENLALSVYIFVQVAKNTWHNADLHFFSARIIFFLEHRWQNVSSTWTFALNIFWILQKKLKYWSLPYWSSSPSSSRLYSAISLSSLVLMSSSNWYSLDCLSMSAFIWLNSFSRRLTMAWSWFSCKQLRDSVSASWSSKAAFCEREDISIKICSRWERSLVHYRGALVCLDLTYQAELGLQLNLKRLQGSL